MVSGNCWSPPSATVVLSSFVDVFVLIYVGVGANEYPKSNSIMLCSHCFYSPTVSRPLHCLLCIPRLHCWRMWHGGIQVRCESLLLMKDTDSSWLLICIAKSKRLLFQLVALSG